MFFESEVYYFFSFPLAQVMHVEQMFSLIPNFGSLRVRYHSLAWKKKPCLISGASAQTSPIMPSKLVAHNHKRRGSWAQNVCSSRNRLVGLKTLWNCANFIIKWKPAEHRDKWGVCDWSLPLRCEMRWMMQADEIKIQMEKKN